MSDSDHLLVASCSSCGARLPLDDFRRDGFLRARRAEDGGPYYELACSRCRAVMVLVREADGSRRVEARTRPGLFGQPFGSAEEEAQRFPPEDADERARAESGRAEPPPDPEPAFEPPPEFDPSFDLEPGESIEQMREALGVDETAERGTILSAFRERSKRMHPDRFAAFDSDFRALAHRKFIELKRARDCLLAIIDRSDDR